MLNRAPQEREAGVVQPHAIRVGIHSVGYCRGMGPLAFHSFGVLEGNYSFS
jgi:hypothetical protein